MCAQFLVDLKSNQLKNKFGFSIADEEDFNQRILPYMKAPVIISEKSQNFLKMMNFSLIPSWSKEKKVKFATHNARIESTDDQNKVTYIFDKPTWKKPFLTKHCLVPITEFIEPIYSGEYKNNMVKFFDKNHELIFASGIWDTWVDKNTGECIDSFTILTDEPSEFIKKIGHERQPLFLKESAFDNWLNSGEKSGQELVSFLRKNKATPDFDVAIFRPLKAKK